ncbi:hypothetical protein DL764_002327 [Monosporascus ibericus]|uniref:RNase H type-1 domain-containing protein n=1 Tax=Monosporascus ibericus TaxID=155417 RepID=A0A4Q4TM22_9PEZI|nr:hypothetical protein DL764_002327 [Monosporascus ibericus]
MDHYDGPSIFEEEGVIGLLDKAMQSTQIQAGFGDPIANTSGMEKKHVSQWSMFGAFAPKENRKANTTSILVDKKLHPGNDTDERDFVPSKNNVPSVKPPPAPAAMRANLSVAHTNNAAQTVGPPRAPAALRLQPPAAPAEMRYQPRRSLRLIHKGLDAHLNSLTAEAVAVPERFSERLLRRMKGARKEGVAMDNYENGAPFQNDAPLQNDKGVKAGTPAPLKVKDGRIDKGSKSRKTRKRLAERLAQLAGQEVSDSSKVSKFSKFTKVSKSSNDITANCNNKNMKIFVTSREQAVQFAKDILEIGIAQVPRLVFYTDGSGGSRVHGGHDVTGAAVAYKRCLDIPTQWVHAAFAIFGSSNSTDAELVAVGAALNIARCEAEKFRQESPESCVAYPTMFIITDSQTALSWIDQYVNGQAARQRVARRLYHAAFTQLLDPLARLESLGVKVEFHWTKGHANVEGNVIADNLAGNAVTWMKKNLLKRQRDPDPTRAFEVHMAPFTSEEVVMRFKDQKEDIRLLLEDSDNNQSHQSAVPHPQDLWEDELAKQEDEQGNREGQEAKEKKKGTVKKLKEAFLPIKRLVQNVTGQKRKHGDSSNSGATKPVASDVSEDGGVTKKRGAVPQGEARGRHIEVIDLTGDDDEEITRVCREEETGTEIIDLTGA